MITSLVLGQINQTRSQLQSSLEQQEVLNLANMAIQTGQNQLSMNGHNISIVRHKGEIRVYQGETEILSLSKN